MSTPAHFECVVVGAGPAGLAASAALTARSVEHVVLERDRVGQTWRTQRWDSFRLNTPGWANTLLGEQIPDVYATRADVVTRLEALAASCPLREGTGVTGLVAAGDGLMLRSTRGDIRARAVIVATGHENVPRIPPLAKDVPDRIAQLHTGGYRNSTQLPDGAVLVVGSGQSGCQITEDLLAAGRRVVLATSAVGRAPGRHRGRATAEWLFEAGFFDQRPQDLPHPAMMHATNPVFAPGARSLSLQMLARAGATLVGRLIAVDGERIRFDDSAPGNVAAGDAFAARTRAMVDEIIRRTGVDAPPAERDDADGPVDLYAPQTLDLRATRVGSVVWCTGSTGDFTWLDPALVDERGQPLRKGVAAVAPGVWYVGLRWLTHRASAQLPGIPKDAAMVADAVNAYLAAGSAPTGAMARR